MVARREQDDYECGWRNFSKASRLRVADICPKVIEARHGSAIAEQAQDILNGDLVGKQSPNTVDTIKRECESLVEEGDDLQRQACTILEAIEEAEGASGFDDESIETSDESGVEPEIL